MTKTAYLASLNAQLIAAEARKEQAGELGLEEVFYDACKSIRDLTAEIYFTESAKSHRGYRCPTTSALIAANVD